MIELDTTQMNEVPECFADCISEQKPEKQMVITKPVFSELSVFGAQELDMIALDTRNTLLERYNALQAWLIARRWAAMFGVVEESLKESAVNSTNAKKESISFNGASVAEVSERKLPAKWQYNDPVLIRMYDQMDQLKSMIKDREKMNQALRTDIADAGTGEIIKPPTKIESGITLAVKWIERNAA